MAKTKSPPAPNFSLEKAFEETTKIYVEFSRANLTEEDIASALGHSSTTSGPFKKKRFTLCQYGLLEEDESGDNYQVSTAYIDLRDHKDDKVRFTATAFKLITNATVFDKLLEGLHDRVPAVDSLASRLEREGFRRERAKDVATTFRESLEFAEVLGADNRLLRPGEAAQSQPEEHDLNGEEVPNDDTHPPAVKGNLTLEFATEDGARIVISYPPSLSSADAEKVGQVLKAVAD